MSKCKMTSIGGQALIEGIMMRGPKKQALAVRTKDNNIDISFLEFKSIKEKYKFLNLPVLRGVVNFIESMIHGYKAMMLSAEKSGYLDEEEEKKPKSEAKEKVIMSAVMTVATVLGVILSVVLFIYLPSLAFKGVNYLAGGVLSGWQSFFEGFIKILIFLGYMIAVSFMKDIDRVFRYHGAEHKTIFCYEAGLELNVENVRKQGRFHPRCGTSFMILMLLVSIFITFIIDSIFPILKTILWLRTIIKILLLPIICGVGYELIKLCGKHNNILTKIVAAPGLWIQRITVKEPDDSMIEVAIAAMNQVIPENEETL
ncbi:MAG: DUF1385 domain-containing protein [Clostridia bacterium]|nr:DUF1385 domain-containing protein [Clostridia bacterium]